MAELLDGGGGAEGGEEGFVELVSRAYSLLPAGGFVPPLRLGQKPEPGDAAAWLDKEVRLGLGPKDPAGDWRKPGGGCARDINYGAGAVPVDAAFRGPLGDVHILLLRESGEWPVEGVVQWERSGLQKIEHLFMFHLRAFMEWLRVMAVSGDTAGEGGY